MQGFRQILSEDDLGDSQLFAVVRILANLIRIYSLLFALKITPEKGFLSSGHPFWGFFRYFWACGLHGGRDGWVRNFLLAPIQQKFITV